MTKTDVLLLLVVIFLTWYGFKFILVQSEAMYAYYDARNQIEMFDKALKGGK